MSAPVFWMTDPEADAFTSPFVRQPAYTRFEERVRELEKALRWAVKSWGPNFPENGPRPPDDIAPVIAEFQSDAPAVTKGT